MDFADRLMDLANNTSAQNDPKSHNSVKRTQVDHQEVKGNLHKTGNEKKSDHQNIESIRRSYWPV